MKCLMDFFGKENFSREWWRDYRRLVKRRQAEKLTPEEQRELMVRTDVLEEVQVWRARALTGMAKMLGLSLAELVKAYGIKPQTVG